MASAFASGFKMGGDMFDSTERNRLAREQLEMAKAADARAAEAHGLQMKSARRIEDATQAVTDAASLGISVPGAQAGNEAAQRESFRRFEIADQNAGGGGERPQYVAPTGIQPTYRPASALELNGLQTSLAAARGDVQGMETMRVARKGIEYDDGYKKHIADWKAMPDEERSKLIGKLSYDTGVKGFGTWTPGQGKQAGYMTYLPPTGDAVKLSDKEAGEVYALSNLMSIDPTRARGELDKVSDKVRAVAAQVFSAQHQGVTVNNDATAKAGTLRIHQQQVDQQGAYQRGVLKAHSATANKPNYISLENESGDAVIVDQNKLKPGQDGVLALPKGLRLPRKGHVQGEGMKVNGDGSVVNNGKLYVPDPSRPGQYMEARGIGPSAVDLALAKFTDNGGEPSVTAPTNNLRPIPKQDITKPSGIGYGNPDNFERRSSRGLFGGMNYEYFDPATGRTLSLDDYNRLTGGN